MPPPLVTNVWFKGKKRPKEFGSVTITFEEIVRTKEPPVIRPISVQGLVAVASTKGRPKAPEPKAGLRVGQEARVPKQFRYDAETGVNAYNTGIPDAEKGHIMALELGGPDLPANIVPQWAKWQGSGEWRRVEEKIAAKAAKGMEEDAMTPYYLMFHAIVGYAKIDTANALLRRVAFPSSFTVTVTKIDKENGTPIGEPKTMYEGSPTRNDTDDMLAMRTFMDVEMRGYKPEEGEEDGDGNPGYADWDSKTKGSGAKKRDASGFGKTGQDKRYTPIPSITYPPPFDLDAYGASIGMDLQVNKKVKGNLPRNDEDTDDEDYTPPATAEGATFHIGAPGPAKKKSAKRGKRR